MNIEKNKVVFENANIPHAYGELNPSNFTPYPKNPNIAKVFREIGFADELGSGVKNLYKYSKAYGGSDPAITEGEVFRIVVQAAQEIKKLSTKERILKELEKDSRLTRDDLSQRIGVSAEAIKQHLSNLKKEGKIKRIGSTKSGYWEVNND